MWRTVPHGRNDAILPATTMTRFIHGIVVRASSERFYAGGQSPAILLVLRALGTCTVPRSRKWSLLPRAGGLAKRVAGPQLASLNVLMMPKSIRVVSLQHRRHPLGLLYPATTKRFLVVHKDPGLVLHAAPPVAPNQLGRSVLHARSNVPSSRATKTAATPLTPLDGERDLSEAAHHFSQNLWRLGSQHGVVPTSVSGSDIAPSSLLYLYWHETSVLSSACLHIFRCRLARVGLC